MIDKGRKVKHTQTHTHFSQEEELDIISPKLWDNDESMAWVIDYFSHPKIALKVKKEVVAGNEREGRKVTVSADIRLIGIEWKERKR